MRYFQAVSAQYKAIADYTANLVISRGDRIQTAVVRYKSPNLLRLDFSNPEGMVITVNDEKLKIWAPQYSVTFEQSLLGNNQGQLSMATTPRGLELMEKHYTIAYADSPGPVPLDDGSNEMVIKLRLNWKSNNEGFRNLELSINPSLKTIRRIKGITTTNESITFDFADIVLNRGIPITKFDYESPPYGNTIDNFLLDPEN
ncbi:MAG: hypothetical protein B6D68_01440 [spirochete symbiont of Stewartia floridana]|nr:MAG: hypothetical protein B6D68_01440 [spirochete symbiont of Stewartia floridana]